MDNSFVLSVYKFQIERGRGGGESLLKSKNAKNHSFQKNQGGVYFESGCAKNYAFQKFWGGGGVKGVLENSR